MSSIYYHSMEKLYYKYSYVDEDSYIVSTFLDNYFIIMMSGNIILSPFNSTLIASITFRNNSFKKIYFIGVYLNTLKKLYLRRKILEMYVSFISSLIVSYCIIDYSYNGWYLSNSWMWHISNLAYLISSCYSDEKVIVLKRDCLKPLRKYFYKYLNN